MHTATVAALAAPFPHASASAPRLLLAEDDSAMRALLAYALRREGYQVVEARDGLELLAHLDRAAFFDAVVTDLRMPGADGLEVLRAAATCDLVPTIVVTAFGDDATHAEARRVGAFAVLDKPFELDDLLGAINLALEVQGRRPPG